MRSISTPSKKSASISSTLTLHGAINNLNKGYLSRETIIHLSDIFVANTMLNNKQEKRDIRDKFLADYGFKSPNFITIFLKPAIFTVMAATPAANPHTSPSPSFDTVCSMIQEVRDKWGASFVVISGGEPYMYRDGDKTILDVYAKFPTLAFLHVIHQRNSHRRKDGS